VHPSVIVRIFTICYFKLFLTCFICFISTVLDTNYLNINSGDVPLINKQTSTVQLLLLYIFKQITNNWTGFEWLRNDPNHLVSCGKDGMLIFHRYGSSDHPVDNVCPVTVRLNPAGHVIHAFNSKLSGVSKSSGKHFYILPRHKTTVIRRRLSDVKPSWHPQSQDHSQTDQHKVSHLSRHVAKHCSKQAKLLCYLFYCGNCFYL